MSNPIIRIEFADSDNASGDGDGAVYAGIIELEKSGLQYGMSGTFTMAGFFQKLKGFSKTVDLKDWDEQPVEFPVSEAFYSEEARESIKGMYLTGIAEAVGGAVTLGMPITSVTLIRGENSDKLADMEATEQYFAQAKLIKTVEDAS